MVFKKIVLALMIASLSGSGFADSFADSPDLGRHGRGQRDERGQRAGPPDRPYHPGQRDEWRGQRAGPPDRPYHPGRRDEWRGRDAVPGYHRFHRGDHVPPEYRTRYYVVDDWRGHRLSPPPRGYHWVQSGADYLLVAIATGIVLQVIANN